MTDHTQSKGISVRPPFVGILAYLAVLFSMPLAHSLFVMMSSMAGSASAEYAVAALTGGIGLVLVWIGLNRGENAGTWLGFFGAVLIWTGWFEFSFDFFANHLDVPAAIMSDGSTMSAHLLVLQSTSIVMLGVLTLLFADQDTRCRAFKWVHLKLRIRPGDPTPNARRNPARITALETVFVIWFFYVINITIYDTRIMGPQHWVTYTIFFSFLVWSVYLFSRLIKFRTMAPALRYAIPTTIISWMCIEISVRWGLFEEIWLRPFDYALEMTLILVAFAIAGAIIMLTPGRDRQSADVEA